MAKLIEGLEQSGESWHKFRLEHIGSSDVAKILLCDPFEGPSQDFQLYLEKSGKKKAGKSATEHTKHGKDNEDTARMMYAAETGNVVLPCVVECDEPEHEYLACSLDGASHDLELIVEIKCPIEAGTFRHAKEGQIEPNYYAQMQHQLFVTRAKRCDYYCWFRGEGVLIPVAPDEGYWLETMLPAVREFWRRVQAKEWPMPEGELRYVTPEEKAKFDAIVNGGGKVDFTYAPMSEAFNDWASKMAQLIEMERGLSNQIAAHKAQGAREFWQNYKKVIGSDIEVARTYKKSYPMNFIMPEQLMVTIRRTA